MPERRRFAVFIDYDNIAIGSQASRNRPFRYEHVLNWIRTRGEVLTQVAYGSWSSHADARQIQSRLAAHGVRMEHLETTRNGGKNGADIALALEALELVFTQQHIDSFCIVSGDSDFLPLVHKLQRYNKRVYVCAAQDTISTNLRRNCNEFVSYEDLVRSPPGRDGDTGRRAPSVRRKPRYDRLEEALPYVKDAIRDMHRHGETPLMNELSEHLAHREPDLDPRSFNCDGFKELIYRMLEAGFLWRQPIGEQMFCVAVSEERNVSPSPRPERPRRDARRREFGPPDEPLPNPDFESPWGFEHSGNTEAQPQASQTRGRRATLARPSSQETSQPEVELPQTDVLQRIVAVLADAVERIESDGQSADLALLYDTVLRIDPKFRSYGARRTAFRPLLERLGREGEFNLTEIDGQTIVKSSGTARDAIEAEEQSDQPEVPADEPARPRPAAKRVSARIAAARAKTRAQPLSSEALRKARAAASGVSAPAPAQAPADGLEFNVTGPVAEALALIVPALRASTDLVNQGLSRDELKKVVLSACPGFKCADYGVRTFRDLFARARNEGLLETRDEDGQGMRYFGTQRLSQLPLPEA